MKPVTFLGDSLNAVREFPESARHKAGFQLEQAQRGLAPDDWKPMPSVGAGAGEIRVWDEGSTFRVIYVAKFEEAIYVLHAFQKKERKTEKRDIDLARARYKELIRTR